MKLIPIKCPNCGAKIEISENSTAIKCEYCNSPILIDDEKIKIQIENLPTLEGYLKLGERYYNDSEYKEAYSVYSKALELAPNDIRAILGKGFSKSLTSTYLNFEIEPAINSMKMAYSLTHESNVKSNIDSSVSKCNHVILYLTNLAISFYTTNALSLVDIRDLSTKLQSCLNAFEYLYSIVDTDNDIKIQIIDNIIMTLNNMIKDKKYRTGQYTSGGTPITSTYKLNITARNELLEKRQQYLTKRSMLDPTMIKKAQKENKPLPKPLQIFFNILCYIMVIWSALSVILSLSNGLIISAFIWLIITIIFIPKVKKIILDKIYYAKTIILICRILLPIIGFLVLGTELPDPFENTWLASNGMSILLEDEHATIKLEDGTILNGDYAYTINNSIYMITVKITNDGSNIKTMKFQYTNKSNIISFYLIQENGTNIYFTPEKQISSYTYTLE